MIWYALNTKQLETAGLVQQVKWIKTKKKVVNFDLDLDNQEEME